MKQCPKCGEAHDKTGTFCSRACANSRGPRTEEFKKVVSEKLSGRKLSEDHISNISGDNHHKRKNSPHKLAPVRMVLECLFCDNEFKTRRGKQQYCSQECYSLSVASTRTAFANYRNACRFTFNVYDFPDYFDLSLVETHGFYSASNKGGNLDGVSRDHMISVRYGFDNAIPATIIAHPANCELMKHSENSSKKAKCSITIAELMKRIEKFEALLAE